MDEDEAVSSAATLGSSGSNGNASGGGGAVQKLWNQIIPQSYRAELEEEERQKELSELYLGPRQRKTVLQNNDENKENQARGLYVVYVFFWPENYEFVLICMYLY